MFLESIANEIAASIARVMSYQSRKMMEDQLGRLSTRFRRWPGRQILTVTMIFFNQRWLDYAGVTTEDVRDWGWRRHAPR
jgi:hypothetical protein